jgi:uncharacterized protein
MCVPRPGLLRAVAAGLAVLALVVLNGADPRALGSPSIVISQVYGGGGNTNAPYTHDFVELFNRSSSPVSLGGWSIQYASATGTGHFGANSGQLTELPAVSLQPGQYYLVQQASGGANGVPLPTPDHTDPMPINMAAASGKVALVTGTTSLGCNGGSAPCDATQLARIIDLVGYGAANFFEGSGAAPALSNTTAGFRADGGCIDTDDNAADFTAGAPAPRNSAWIPRLCDGPPVPILSIDDVSGLEGDSGTTTFTFTVRLSVPALDGGVTFNIATADGTATVADDDYVAQALTGQTIAAGEETYSFHVTVRGDTKIEPIEHFLVNVMHIAGADPGKVQGIGTILADDFPVSDVVISQVYGGGGNVGTTWTNDFVELFNHGTEAVSLDGWSVQYTSAAGTGTWQRTLLTGTIAPGGYYLVQQAAGTGGTTPLPSPDAVGTIAMAAGAGKVVLRASTAALSGACPIDPTFRDLVGYGAAATCFEGSAPTGNLSNTTAALRKRGGCFDSNDNGIDFLTGAPTPRNSASPLRSCEYQTLAIHDIQGSGLATPYLGQDVITTGVVTGLKANGFFLQTPDDDVDDDPLTSQGLFVFTSAIPAVAVGDGATVKGTATEFFNLTQIEATLPGDVTVTTTANPLPMPVVLTTTWLDPNGLPTQLEPLEGMRVLAPSVVSVAPTNSFGEIDTVLTGVPRPMREPGIGVSLPVPPDPVSLEVDCCIPRWDENPERIMINTTWITGMPGVHVTTNTAFLGVTGPLDFAFGRYKILPDSPPAPINGGMSAMPVPAPGANEFTVASYNIQNFSGDETQQRKAALHIRHVMRAPDIIGVIEIASLAALQGLAAQIDADAAADGEPPPAYEALLVPATGSQHVGFLVKASRVQVQSVSQELAGETLEGTTSVLHDRPPLVLRATIDPAGTHPGEVIVLVNHTRSFIGIERLDAEGARVRAKRTQQAESLAQLLQTLQADNPGIPVISVGDYNAFEFNDGYTDPIAILKGLETDTNVVVVQGSPDLVEPDFVNLTDTLPAAERYTYIFEGTPQALDHVLVNTVGLGLFQRYAVARSNADFPRSFFAGLTTDPTVPEGNSDHDSPVAYFAFPGTPVVTLIGGATIAHEAFTPFVDPGATAHNEDGPLPVTTTGAVNVNVPGTYILTYSATNGFWTTSVERTVIVADTIAPAIDGFSLTPTMLGPPNHMMVDVALSYTVTDASGAFSCSAGVASNEAPNAIGDGNTAIDWEVVSTHHVRLRAQRAGGGSGRIYTVTLTCADSSGNTSAATAIATVAHDNR